MKFDVTQEQTIQNNMISRGITPIAVFIINDTQIIAVYQGNKSDYDIIVKYRQRNPENGEWSRIRTPRHDHWIIDLLIKKYGFSEDVKDFLIALLKVWDDDIESFTGLSDRTEKIKNIPKLLEAHINQEKFKRIWDYGFFNLEFLFYVAVLLMFQEKTNYPDGVLFQGILKALKKEKIDLFEIMGNNW